MDTKRAACYTSTLIGASARRRGASRRPHWRRRSACVLVAAALAVVCPVVSRQAGLGAAESPPSSVLWGDTTASGPWDLAGTVDVERAAGKQASLLNWSQDFAYHPNFDTALVDGVLGGDGCADGLHAVTAAVGDEVGQEGVGRRAVPAGGTGHPDFVDDAGFAYLARIGALEAEPAPAAGAVEPGGDHAVGAGGVRLDAERTRPRDRHRTIVYTSGAADRHRGRVAATSRSSMSGAENGPRVAR